MRNRSLKTIVAVIFAIQLFVSISGTSAQTRADMPATGSISGVVTFEGTPAKDVGVLLLRMGTGPREATSAGRIRTGKDGSFTFEGLERGQYGIDAYAPGLFAMNDSPRDGAMSISLGDGEAVKKVAITLEKGGAITGKLTDEESNPIAAQRVRVYVKHANGQFGEAQVWERSVMSDDRGIYRVFGLAPGTYSIGAGSTETERTMNRGFSVQYDRRFYGGATTVEESKPVELSRAGEAQGIDIVLKRTADGYTIRGRVIQAVTKKPVSNTVVRFGPLRDGRAGFYTSAVVVSDSGDFNLQGIASGDYGLTAGVRTSDAGSYVADPVEVSVVDRDVNDIVIELKPAATLKGMIAPVETDAGLDLSSIADQSLLLVGVVDSSAQAFGMMRGPTVGLRVRPDRTFTAVGLRPGNYRVTLSPWAPVKGFYVVRMEVEGAAVVGPLRIEGAETVANVRIVIGRAAGVVRGRVVARNGTIDFGRVGISAAPVGSDAPPVVQRVDSAGAFILEGLPPGEAEVKAGYYATQGQPPIVYSMRVSVPADGAVDVTIEIDLDADPEQKGGGQ